MFTGQLYLANYRSYLQLCHFLDVLTTESPKDTTVRWNLFDIPGSFKKSEIRFSGSPLPSVMALLAMRSKGQPFAETHMGKILQGQFLIEKDFERPLPAVFGHNPPTYDMRMPHDVTSGNMPLSPFDMQCNVQDSSGPSVLLHSCK